MNVALALGLTVLAAGAKPPHQYEYPLPACSPSRAPPCLVQLVVDADAVERRDMRYFPQR